MKTPSTRAYTFMAWLGLAGAIGAVTVAHAEDPFNSHRLFFTEAQRKESALTATNDSPVSLPDTSTQGPADADAISDTKRVASKNTREKAGSVDFPDSRHRRVSRAGHDDPVNSHQVYFTALVTGTREPRVVVNGLPCEPVTTKFIGTSDQPFPIDCHGVQSDGLRLTVLSATEELLVTDKGGRVYRLLPGEAM